MSELEEFLRGAAQLRAPRQLRELPAEEAAREAEPAARGPLQPLTRADALGSSQRLGPDHLAQDVDQTDERVAARLHQKFDRQLGKFARQELTEEFDDSVARQLADMLSRPESIRQAVIVAEVLRSPLERWEGSW